MKPNLFTAPSVKREPIPSGLLEVLLEDTSSPQPEEWPRDFLFGGVSARA